MVPGTSLVIAANPTAPFDWAIMDTNAAGGSIPSGSKTDAHGTGVALYKVRAWVATNFIVTLASDITFRVWDRTGAYA
jgi:hypothetical protein